MPTFLNFKSLFFIVVIALFANIGYEILESRLTGTCANSISCLGDMSGEYRSDHLVGEFAGKKVIPPAPESKKTVVLGESTEGGHKHINIDLSNQKLFAMEGERIVYEFPVSTGKWSATPTGEFRTWIKLRYTRMQGGSKVANTYYNLPNVPNTMYFYNPDVPKTRGYGIHGAYWHNNFGNPMSHGCVNMTIADSKTLFEWAPLDTVVVIYGTTPGV